MNIKNNQAKSIARKVNVSLSTVRAVIAHQRPRIGQMPDKRMAVGRQLQQISSAYYGFDAGEQTIDVATTMVLDKYHDLTVTDIAEAYKTAAAGSLGNNYQIKGRFTVTDMAKILSAFRPIRNRIVDEARTLTAKTLPSGTKPLYTRSGIRKYRNNQEFYDDLPRLFTDFMGSGKKRPIDVPAFWYDAAVRAGLLDERELNTTEEHIDEMAREQMRIAASPGRIHAAALLQRQKNLDDWRKTSAKQWALWEHLNLQYA